MVLSIYHFGIEQNLWLGFTECSSNISFNNDSLKNLLSKDPIRCQNIQFKVLNISLAGWNGLVSMSLFTISILLLYLYNKGIKDYEK